MTSNKFKFKVYVQPNSKKNEVAGEHGDAIKIKIKAPPVDGEANAEVIKFLSKIFNLSKNEISISSGETGRIKIIEINSTTPLTKEIALNIIKQFAISK